MGQGLKFWGKANCQCVSGPEEAPRMQSVVQRLRAGDAHGGELPQAGLVNTEATLFTSVSPVLMGVDALHQLKNAIFKKCVCAVCGSEARVGSPGAGVVTYLTRVLGT